MQQSAELEQLPPDDRHASHLLPMQRSDPQQSFETLHPKPRPEQATQLPENTPEQIVPVQHELPSHPQLWLRQAGVVWQLPNSHE